MLELMKSEPTEETGRVSEEENIALQQETEGVSEEERRELEKWIDGMRYTD